MRATFLTLPEESALLRLGSRLSSLTGSMFHSVVRESVLDPSSLAVRASIHSAHMSMQSGQPVQHLEASASCIIEDKGLKLLGPEPQAPQGLP